LHALVGCFVPMLIINFDSSSNPLILGGSIAVTLFNIPRRNPFFDRPLINYNIAAIIGPLSWLGTILGVLVNAVIPDWLLYSVLLVLLTYTAYNTFKKAWAEYRKRHPKTRDAAAEREEALIGGVMSETTPGEIDAVVDGDVLAETTVALPVGAESAPEPVAEAEPFVDPLAEELNAEEEPTAEEPQSAKKPANFSIAVLVVFAVSWVIIALIPFVRGGRNAKSFAGVAFCSPAYWGITFAPFPVYAGIVAFIVLRLRKHPVLGDKIGLEPKQIALSVVAGLTAGLCSGFLGVGGGVILTPFLLGLGIQAEAMAATSSFLILLTTATTSLAFIARGSMPMAEFGIYAAIGFVSFLIGANALKMVIQKTGNRSLVLWCLGSAIALGAVLMGYIGVSSVVKSVKQHAQMSFRPMCNV
jgi:uncharacterized membrane protein YfcA